MKINCFKLIITLLLPFLFVHTLYADDAEIRCKQIAGLEWGAVREQPAFVQSGSIGCDALPSQIINNINILCDKNVPTTMTPNCSVTYYAKAPADTVVQCSGIPSQGQESKVIFKYALCQKSNKDKGYYVWALLIKSIDKKSVIPDSVWQKK